MRIANSLLFCCMIDFSISINFHLTLCAYKRAFLALQRCSDAGGGCKSIKEGCKAVSSQSTIISHKDDTDDTDLSLTFNR